MDGDDSVKGMCGLQARGNPLVIHCRPWAIAHTLNKTRRKLSRSHHSWKDSVVVIWEIRRFFQEEQ